MKKSLMPDPNVFPNTGLYVAPSTAGSMTYSANALIAGIGNQGHG